MITNNDWHTISAEETAKRLKVDPYVGLSEREARRRRTEYGKNNIWHIARTDAGKAILSAAGDLSSVLLLITAILSFFFEERREAIAMCAILVIGAVLRIVTYVKAKGIFEKNAEENIPTASVLREGTIRPTSAQNLVPGDIILLHPGDTVPCDGRVISHTDSTVTESGITENRDEVHKYNTVIKSKPGSAAIPCESRPNFLYAGSTVLTGNPRMIACATGEDSLVFMKQGGIELPAGGNLPLIEKLNGRCKASELLMLAFVLLVSAISLFIKSTPPLGEVFFAAVSTAAASMSEYLTAIGFIIIAIAAQKTSGKTSVRGKKSGKRTSVIKDCGEIEKIAGADRMIIGSGDLLKSGKAILSGFFAEGTFHRQGSADPKALGKLLSLAAGAVGLGEEASSLAAESGDNPLSEREQLLRKGSILYAEETGKSPFSPFHIIERTNSPLTGGLDLAILLRGADTTPYAAAAGDVQSVLRCCTTYRTEKGVLPLTNEIKKRIFTETARLEYIGARILAAAIRPAPYLSLSKASSILQEMCFEGFFSIAEMPAEGVRDTIRELRESGTQIILLSSNAEHDLYYGHDLGLFNKETKIVPHTCPRELLQTEPTLIVTVPPYSHTNTEQDLAASAARYSVVKHAGEGTAFLTKDALDSRALSAADCGIAVSSSLRKGTAQALKKNASVVVFAGDEDEFGGFAEGIRSMKEGRRAMINTVNASLYLTASQLTRLLILLAGILLGLTVPTPAAVLIGGLLLDFGAVLTMAFEKAPKNAFSIPCKSLPKLTEQITRTLIDGILAAALSLSVPLLVNGAAPLLHVHPLTGKESVSLVSASLFLSSLTLFLQFMRRDRFLTWPPRRGNTVVSSAALCFVPSVLSISALILLEKHCASLVGGAPVPWYGALCALLPGILLFFIIELEKKIRERKKH